MTSSLPEVTTDKTAKLLSRGSESPKVALAARHISEILTRMSLGQVNNFAEIIETIFLDLTPTEFAALEIFFFRVASYFQQRSEGEYPSLVEYPDSLVRSWKTDDAYFYQVHKLFCVLACDLPYCTENRDCWETRYGFCRMDGDRFGMPDRLTEATETTHQTEK